MFPFTTKWFPEIERKTCSVNEPLKGVLMIFAFCFYSVFCR